MLWGIPLVAAGAGVAILRSRPPQIEVAVPVERVVVGSIAVSGRLRGEIETNVGAQAGGRVAEVPVREGDRVSQGQILARIDGTVLEAQRVQATSAVRTAGNQLRQARRAAELAEQQRDAARDALATAEAQLALASRKPLASEFARLEAETAQAVAVAEARALAARQRLAELKAGPTREEREQAQAQAEQAKASLEQAERDLARQRELLRTGAVAASVVDSAATAAMVARRTHDAADARWRQIRVGTRPELLAQAEADLRAADATVAGAKASGKAQMDSLKASPRAEDVLVARRRVDEAKRAVLLAETRAMDAREAVETAQARVRESELAVATAIDRVADTTVRAPFDGTVVKVVTEVGGIAGPSAPLVSLVRTARPEIRIDLDESNLGKVKIGQEATVSCDAFPGETFPARVRRIGAQVDTDRGTVEVALVPESSPEWLRPGQTLSVNLVVDRGVKRLVVPLTAVQTVGGASSLVVVEDGVLKRRTVKIDAPGPDGFPVSEGVALSDRVVVDPTGRKDGERVAPRVVGNGKG